MIAPLFLLSNLFFILFVFYVLGRFHPVFIVCIVFYFSYFALIC